jgi:hypothetical protein
MLGAGFAAPHFDCTAVVDGQDVRREGTTSSTNRTSILEAVVSDFTYWPGVEDLLHSVRASGFPVERSLWN